MTDENPTIPQIVRALTTLHDRHGDRLVEVSEAYEAKIKAMTPEPLPELEEGEYFHLEYVQLNPVEEGGYLSNMVDLAHTRDEAVSKLRELIGSKYVYAIHVRRYPEPEKGVHVYDEHNSLAVAQSKAYMESHRATALEKAHDEIVVAKADLETGYDQIVTSMEDTEKALTRVIETLMDRMRRVDSQLRRDTQNCTYSEPGELLNLMFGVGIVPDERWERQMISKARQEVRDERKKRDAIEQAKQTSVWPLAPLQGASDRRRCACGRTWHMNEVPRWHNGLECQPEPCETVFNGGLCVGAKGHKGPCSPHPKDIQQTKEG